MLPPGHFLVAGLPVIGYLLWRDRRVPGLRTWFVIGVGSQFPDLVDKPLAHSLFLLPTGRVGVHSLPIAIPIAAVALYVGWKLHRRRAGMVFVFAYVTHLVADYYKLLLRPDSVFPPGLLWPLVPATSRRLEPAWAGPGSVNVKLWSAFSVAVLLVGLYLLFEAYRSASPGRS